MSLSAVKRQLLLQTLKATGGNKERAAEILGVTTKTLYNHLKSYQAGLSTSAESSR
jgi:DNA-binding NtrC family response regulator